MAKILPKDLPRAYKDKLTEWRKLKDQGKLDKEVIKIFKKENILHLLVTRQEFAEETCRKLCDFIKTNKTSPQRSKNPEENSLYRWLMSQKSARNGKSKHKHYDTLQAIADSYGIPDLFELKDRKTIAEDMCHQLCQFVKTNNRKPNKQSKDPKEKSLGNWLFHQRRSIMGKGNSVHYPTLIEIAKSYKLPDLFK